MGMSATQSNLLYLTSRLHDVENTALFIESQKIALATQQDEIYNAYCDALDATKIQVAFNSTEDGKRYFIDATFDNVCTYDPTRCKQYALANAETGRLYVTEDTKKTYEMFKDDKYSFAWEMLNLSNKVSAGNWNGNWSNNRETEISVSKNGYSLTDVEELIYRKHSNLFKDNGSKACLSSLDKSYNAYIDVLDADDSNISINEKLEAMKTFKESLYATYGTEIYELMRLDKNTGNFPGFFSFDYPDRNEGESDEDYEQRCIEEFNKMLKENQNKSWDDGRQIYSYEDFEDWYNHVYIKEDKSYTEEETNRTFEIDDDNLIGTENTFPKSEFDYYLNLWTKITEAGGCEEVPMSAQCGDESNKWFNDMVKSGRAIISVYNETTKEWGETNVATSVNVNFLQENQDETDLKKAEAEYEYQLNLIEKKDTEFDRELSKLETERSSIKQIMESITKVLDENIDRTFNLFS